MLHTSNRILFTGPPSILLLFAPAPMLQQVKIVKIKLFLNLQTDYSTDLQFQNSSLFPPTHLHACQTGFYPMNGTFSINFILMKMYYTRETSKKASIYIQVKLSQEESLMLCVCLFLKLLPTHSPKMLENTSQKTKMA